MSLSAPFIHRPVGTTLLTVAIALAGGLAYLFLPVSPLPQVEFPTIRSSPALPGRQPGDDGLGGGDAARAAVRPHRRHHRDDLDQLARHRRSITLQFDLDREHRRRGPRRAGGDQRRARPAAGQPAEQPVLPQGQSGRRADHDPGADLRRRTTGRRCTTSASSILQQRLVAGRGRRPGDRRRRRAAGGARRVNPTVLNHTGLGARGRAHGPRRRERQPAQGQIADADSAWSITDDRPVAQGRGVPAAHRRLPKRGAACASSDVAERDRLGRGHPHRRPLERQAGDHAHHLPPAGREHHRHGRPRSAALLPQLQASIPPTMKLVGRHRPRRRRSAPRCATSSSRW